MSGKKKFANITSLRNIVFLSGAMVLLTGLVTLAGWISGNLALAGISDNYIPTSFASAICFILLGSILCLGICYSCQKKTRIVIAVIITIMAVYGFLQFSSVFFHADFFIDHLLFPVRGKIDNFPINRMSPYTGLLFFISNTAMLVKLFGKNKILSLSVVGTLGLIIAFAGFLAGLGYIFGTPFLYSGNLIPMAAPTAFCFLFLGCGLIAISGSRTFVLRHFSGNTASARVLRTILPLIVAGILFDSFLQHFLTSYLHINPALLLALLTIILVILTSIVIINVTRIIFRNADKEEGKRILAEKALRESEEKFRAIFENNSSALAIIEPDTTISMVNDAYCLMSGYSHEEVVGMSWTLHIPPGDLERLKEYNRIRLTNPNEAPDKYEFMFYHKNGKIKHGLMSVAMIKSYRKIIVSFTDITERKQNELELLKYSEELKESNATKDKFFSIIAHDLKSPFNSIIGFSELLMENYREYSEKEIEDSLNTIKKSSRQAYDLLENLLVWARSQTGKIDFRPETFALSQDISNTLAIARSIAGKKNIQIINNIQEPCLVYADKNMLNTILRNLLANAIKYTPRNGSIIIDCRQRNGNIEFLVKDNGIGIPKQNIGQLFRIDSKYSTPGTEKEQGTGLGLILCREFVEKHGGKIWAESEEGKGSAFSFTLPLH
ncbi:MAG: PAS domain-containing sensor histidine kinase [Lentimicrobiaceae bacterium]|nr:PAS domain-containing sensor histidine kinase [Lentimicrobiaceae bacterium]